MSNARSAITTTAATRNQVENARAAVRQDHNGGGDQYHHTTDCEQGPHDTNRGNDLGRLRHDERPRLGTKLCGPEAGGAPAELVPLERRVRRRHPDRSPCSAFGTAHSDTAVPPCCSICVRPSSPCMSLAKASSPYPVTNSAQSTPASATSNLLFLRHVRRYSAPRTDERCRAPALKKAEEGCR